MTIAEHNAWFFDFFRNRIEFVSAHCVPSNDIAGYILWGACADALAQIRAACCGAKKGNREQFVDFLIDFRPDLETISVPLLTHDLQHLPANGKARAAALLQESVFCEYQDAVGLNRVWQSDDDRRCNSSVLSLATCDICADQLWPIVRRNRYADLLYLQYRNPAVHGVDLELKTSNAALPLPGAREPHYMNHRYDSSGSRGKAQQYRTRISFSLNYLTKLLSELVDELEQGCVANGWRIPAYATIGLK